MNPRLVDFLTELYGPIPADLRGWAIFATSIAVWLAAAWIADVLIGRYLRRLVAHTDTALDDAVADVLHVPVPATVLAAGVSGTLGALQSDARLALVSDSLAQFVHNGIWSVWLAVAAWSSVRASGLLIEGSFGRIADRTGVSAELRPFLQNLAKVSIAFTTVLVLFNIWDQPVSTLLASAGLVGAAVAFAARETLANFIGGISLFLERSVKLGDYIVLDSGERGEVMSIGIRSTHLKTRDDVMLTIPNGIMANTVIRNQSAPHRAFRVRVAVGAAYGSDVEQVEQLLVAEAEANETALADPYPRVRLRRFGDSALEFELLCWCRDPGERGRLVHQLSKAIYKTFEREGIEIPFPQREVRLIPYTPDRGSSDVELD